MGRKTKRVEEKKCLSYLLDMVKEDPKTTQYRGLDIWCQT